MALGVGTIVIVVLLMNLISVINGVYFNGIRHIGCSFNVLLNYFLKTTNKT